MQNHFHVVINSIVLFVLVSISALLVYKNTTYLCILRACSIPLLVLGQLFGTFSWICYVGNHFISKTFFSFLICLPLIHFLQWLEPPVQHQMRVAEQASLPRSQSNGESIWSFIIKCHVCCSLFIDVMYQINRIPLYASLTESIIHGY